MWLVYLLLVLTFNKFKLKKINSAADFSPQVLIFSLGHHVYSSNPQDMEYAAGNQKTHVINNSVAIKEKKKT